jgi:hypothetical protein
MATRRTTNQAYRIEENERNAASMATRHTTNQAYRIEENERNAQAMVTRCTDLAYRIPEQIADTLELLTLIAHLTITMQTSIPEHNKRIVQSSMLMMMIQMQMIIIY